MSELLASDPFGQRSDAQLLDDLNALTRHHLEGCLEYARLLKGWRPAKTLEDVPYLHVGLFKRITLMTQSDDIRHQRTLTSSTTTGSSPSQIMLDERSSKLQSQSVEAIHRAWLGGAKRPLLILDEAAALKQRGFISARLAAALSLQPLASETHFILENGENPAAVRWELVRSVLGRNPSVMLYGPTWGLWQAWASPSFSPQIAALLRTVQIDYVHSGGWKKLKDIQVDPREFESRLAAKSSPNSRVIDYYGLTEQVGLLFPLCSAGRRHAPVWAEAIVRDIYTLKPVCEQAGFLHLMNPLAWGAPYHSVLTEDIGRRSQGACPCGRSGRHFELLGRVPRAEIRGCANV